MQSDAIRCNQGAHPRPSARGRPDAIRCDQMSSEVIGGHRKALRVLLVVGHHPIDCIRRDCTRHHAGDRTIGDRLEETRRDVRHLDAELRPHLPSDAIRCNLIESEVFGSRQRHQRAIRGPSLGNHLMFRERAGGCMQRAITRQLPHVPREGGWLHARSRGRRPQSRQHC